MKKVKKSAAVSTFLGVDAVVEGIFRFQGAVRIDGQIKGRIYSPEGTVIIGETARVHADIAVNSAIVMGAVEGDIDAVESIQVHAPGQVVGDIHSPVISIDSGATFNGNCGMKARKVEPPSVEELTGDTSKKPLTN